MGGGRLALHALFESLVIDLLNEASFAAVARRLGLSWDEVDGIMSRAGFRGRSRREEHVPTGIGLDETSFQKLHEYVTVVTELDASRVVAMLDGWTDESVDASFSGIPERSRVRVEAVAMDMWRESMTAAAEWLRKARVCFDRFHVDRHLGEAVNTVRKQEHRSLLEDGDQTQTWTKYLWLESPRTMDRDRRTLLTRLREACAHGSCLSVEEDGVSPVELHQKGLGEECLGVLGGVGIPKQAAADGQGGRDGTEAP